MRGVLALEDLFDEFGGVFDGVDADVFLPVILVVTPPAPTEVYAGTYFGNLAGNSGEWALRFHPDGDATNCVIDAEYEMPGKMPGFVKDIMNKGWFERQTRNMLADFKAIAEAKVPAKV